MLPPLALADMVAGLYGAYAVMIALRVVERGGKGQVIDLPLLDPIISILGPEAAVYRVSGVLPQRTGSRSMTSSPRNVYATGDGRFIAISASIRWSSSETMAPEIGSRVIRTKYMPRRFQRVRATLRSVGNASLP